jgi:hypothetical protein
MVIVDPRFIAIYPQPTSLDYPLQANGFSPSEMMAGGSPNSLSSGQNDNPVNEPATKSNYRSLHPKPSYTSDLSQAYSFGDSVFSSNSSAVMSSASSFLTNVSRQTPANSIYEFPAPTEAAGTNQTADVFEELTPGGKGKLKANPSNSIPHSIKCPDCGRILKRPWIFTRHQTTVHKTRHKGTRVYGCGYMLQEGGQVHQACGQLQYGPESRIQHIKTHVSNSKGAPGEWSRSQELYALLQQPLLRDLWRSKEVNRDRTPSWADNKDTERLIYRLELCASRHRSLHKDNQRLELSRLIADAEKQALWMLRREYGSISPVEAGFQSSRPSSSNLEIRETPTSHLLMPHTPNQNFCHPNHFDSSSSDASATNIHINTETRLGKMIFNINPFKKRPPTFVMYDTLREILKDTEETPSPSLHFGSVSPSREESLSSKSYHFPSTTANNILGLLEEEIDDELVTTSDEVTERFNPEATFGTQAFGASDLSQTLDNSIFCSTMSPDQSQSDQMVQANTERLEPDEQYFDYRILQDDCVPFN